MAMKFVVGIEDILEDVRYTNHTCHNCLCYKCMILRWAKYFDQCICHLDLKNNWGLDMVVRKTSLSCKCWKYYPYYPSCLCCCMALMSHPMVSGNVVGV